MGWPAKLRAGSLAGLTGSTVTDPNSSGVQARAALEFKLHRPGPNCADHWCSVNLSRHLCSVLKRLITVRRDLPEDFVTILRLAHYARQFVSPIAEQLTHV